VSLGKYGEVGDKHEENWSRTSRYPVVNGKRIAMLTLVQHTLSHIVVTGHRTLIFYEGQPTTCYGCNETGHMYQVCRIGGRKNQKRRLPRHHGLTWRQRGWCSRVPARRRWKWGRRNQRTLSRNLQRTTAMHPREGTIPGRGGVRPNARDHGDHCAQWGRNQ